MHLSEHFTLAECTASQTAARLRIDNDPAPETLESMKLVAEHVLEPVRDHYARAFRPNSFFRCLDLNQAIGSSDGSQHLKGEAVDFEVPGVSNLILAHWCQENLDFDQLILEFHRLGDPASGWVHCSYVSPADNRGSILTIDRSGPNPGLSTIGG